MKCISFSLFGSSPVYTVGAIRNSELVHTIFPGWVCVFYVDKSVPQSVKTELKKNRAIVRECDKDIPDQVFWRFLIASDPKVERYIIRDADSRLIQRDSDAVREWEKSGLSFHSIRDHPAHTCPLGAGLWGGTPKANIDMLKLIKESRLYGKPYSRETTYGTDQRFLAEYLWPFVEESLIQHDSCTRHLYPSSRPFPSGCRFGDWRFVGEIINEREEPHPIHWQQRINHMTP